MNPQAANCLRDAVQYLQQATDILELARAGFGGRTLTPEEIVMVLRRFHNAIGRTNEAAWLMNHMPSTNASHR